MQQEILQPTSASSLSGYEKLRMTDLTLSLLQDSGWYDVKYGSAGFNPHGYLAGCAFATSDIDGLRADISASLELCSANMLDECDISQCESANVSQEDFEACILNLPPSCTQCVSDHSAVGHCWNSALDNGFPFPRPVRPRRLQLVPLVCPMPV